MSRFITFRFDDGFVRGARLAAHILTPHMATFFIVSGLVTREADRSVNQHFMDADFGSNDDWRRLAADGHDIQPHSVTHRRLNTLTREECETEVQNSAKFVRTLRPEPHPLAFCFPYNQMQPLDWPRLGVDAAGFINRPSDMPINTNHLDTLDLFQLTSWAVRERHLGSIIEQLGGVDDGTWTILGLHSLDGEGFEPWSAKGLERLLVATQAMTFEIVTVAAMVRQLRTSLP